MEFTTRKSELLKELDLAQGVSEKKTTIPILSNILIEAEGAELRLSATDLDLGLRCGCPARVKTAGASTVPGRRLLDIVRSLPDADIKFKSFENHFIQLTCERSSFKLAGMAKDNFPALPESLAPIAVIPASALAPMIQRTAFAISNEESRYTLNGALLVLKPDRVSMVATDGHRLAQVEKEIQIEGLNTEIRVLIPRKAMTELPRLLAQGGEQTPVRFARDESHLFFAAGHRILISRVLTGQFPNYEAVLPKENSRSLTVSPAALRDSIQRAALLADERSRVIRFQLSEGKLEIFSSSGDLGDAHEELPVEYSQEAMQIGFNYQYLLDFLNAAGESEKVRIDLKDEQSAGLFRPAADDGAVYRYVVMPMRV